MKIRKIGNKTYLVKDVEGKEVLEEVETEGAPAETTPAEDFSEEEKEEINKQASDIASAILKNLNLGGNKDNSEVQKLNEKVDKLFETDSKLKTILGGKSFDSKELTSEEKIVAFYHSLVTDNKIALKALSEGTDADGGYLFPNEFMTEIIKELPNINVMRNEVRIINMRRDKMDITSLVSGPKTSWTAEKATISTTTAMFSQQELKVFKLASILYATDELIEDSDITNVVNLIIEQFAEAIADEEETAIWTGNGTTRPQGLSDAGAGITSVGTGSGNIVNDLNKLYRSLPAKYRANAKWYMSDATMANLENVKDSEGRMLLQPALSEATPERIKGKTVVISVKVPANQIYFGDMKKTYFLGDRKRMSVKLSQDTTEAFTKGQTAVRVIHRVGGKVVFPQATRKLTGLV